MNRRSFFSKLFILGSSSIAALSNLKFEFPIANASTGKGNKLSKIAGITKMDTIFTAYVEENLKNMIQLAHKNPEMVKDKAFLTSLENSRYQQTISRNSYGKLIQDIERKADPKDLAAVLAVLESEAGKAHLRFREIEYTSTRSVAYKTLQQVSKKLFKIQS